MLQKFIAFKEKYKDRLIYFNIFHINSFHSSSSPEDEPCTVINTNDGNFLRVEHTVDEVANVIEKALDE